MSGQLVVAQVRLGGQEVFHNEESQMQASEGRSRALMLEVEHSPGGLSPCEVLLDLAASQFCIVEAKADINTQTASCFSLLGFGMSSRPR